MIIHHTSINTLLAGYANLKLIVKVSSEQLMSVSRYSSHSCRILIALEQALSMELLVRQETTDLDQNDMHFENRESYAPKTLNANLNNLLTDHADLKLM